MAIAWLSKIKSQVRVKAYENVKTGKGLPVIRLQKSGGGRLRELSLIRSRESFSFI